VHRCGYYWAVRNKAPSLPPSLPLPLSLSLSLPLPLSLSLSLSRSLALSLSRSTNRSVLSRRCHVEAIGGSDRRKHDNDQSGGRKIAGDIRRRSKDRERERVCTLPPTLWRPPRAQRRGQRLEGCPPNGGDMAMLGLTCRLVSCGGCLWYHMPTRVER
jgi:hypothetical protein